MTIFYYPIDQNTVNKTVSEKNTEVYNICLYMYVHIVYYFFLFTGLIPV